MRNLRTGPQCVTDKYIYIGSRTSSDSTSTLHNLTLSQPSIPNTQVGQVDFETTEDWVFCVFSYDAIVCMCMKCCTREGGARLAG